MHAVCCMLCVCVRVTHGAAVHQGLDVGVGLVAELLVVGRLQLQRPLVAALGAAVGPGHGALAVVGEVLTRLNAQQPQEAKLDHAHRLPASVHVGELEERRGPGSV